MGNTVDNPKPRTIAVASGKGGVGKSVITANLAVCLAQQLSVQGGSVVAIDMDLGCGNLNACLGVRAPNGSINRYLSDQESHLAQVLTPTELSNLKMICSSYGGSPEIELSGDQKKDLMVEINSLPADFILLDLGAGISSDVLDMFLAATDKVIVITPESLSLHNAFVFLKTVILHYLWRELEREDVLSTVRKNWGQMIDDREHLDIRSLIQRVKVWDRYAAFVLAGLINELEIKFVVNRYQGGIENAHLRKFHRLLYKYLCVRSNISYLGFVHSDRDVLASTQALVPFVLEYPENRAAKDIRNIANLLIADEVLDNTPQLQLPRESEPISLVTHARTSAQPQAAKEPIKHRVLGDPPPIKLSASLKPSQ